MKAVKRVKRTKEKSIFYQQRHQVDVALRGEKKGEGPTRREREQDRKCVQRPLSQEPTWSVVPVQDGESEEGSVAMSSEGGLGQGRQVVHVVETWAVCVIVARQQHVHVIRSLEGGRKTGGHVEADLLFRSLRRGFWTILTTVLQPDQSGF